MYRIISIFLIGLTCSAWAQDEEWKMQVKEDQYILPSGYAFHISNPLGPVRVQPSKDEKCHVTARITFVESFEGVAQLEPKMDANGIQLHVLFLKEGKEMEALTPLTVKVDLILQIPEKHDLHVTTDAGPIEIDRAGSAIHAKSKTGNIVIKANGPVTSYSSTGKTKVYFYSRDKLGGSDIQSYAGALAIYLPEGCDALFTGKTRGKVVSDYRSEVVPDKDSKFNSITINLGKATQKINALSEQGGLQIFSFFPG